MSLEPFVRRVARPTTDFALSGLAVDAMIFGPYPAEVGQILTSGRSAEQNKGRTIR